MTGREPGGPLELSLQQALRVRRDAAAREQGRIPVPHNAGSVFDVRGAFDPDRYEQALALVVARHDVLRTAYQPTTGDRPRAWLTDPHVMLERSSGSPTSEQLDAFEQHAFAPDQLKVATTAWRVSEGHTVLGVVVDHLAMDGRSWPVFLRDLSAAYSDADRFAASSAPSYFDFAAEQRAQLEGEFLATRLAYWRSRLDPLRPFGEEVMPGAHAPLGSVRTARRAWCVWDVDLGSVARHLGATPFAVILATHILLRARRGESVCTTHIPVDVRPSRYAHTVGWFSSGMVHRYRVRPDERFAEMCLGVLGTIFTGIDNFVPIPVLQRELEPNRLAFVGWRPVCFFDVLDRREAYRFDLLDCEVVERTTAGGVALRDGAAFFFELYPAQVRVMVQFQAEAWCDDDAKKLLNDIGRVWSILGVSSDVTVGELWHAIGATSGESVVSFEG